jgi:hypothetical protein
MPTKEERPDDVPTTNVKAGFPGTTTSSVKPDDPGATPAPPPQDKNNPQAGQEGPSASARGGHVIDDGSEPLPGQPMKDSASGEETVTVRTTGTPLKGGAQDKSSKKS